MPTLASRTSEIAFVRQLRTHGAGRILIEAPRGYGKSVAVDRLDHLPRPVRVASIGEFCAHVDVPSTGCTPIIDDLDAWSEEDRDALTAVLGTVAPDAGFVVVGRSCPPALRGLLVLMGTRIVAADELRLTADTVDQLLQDAAPISSKQRQILVELIDGWPLLADRVLAQLATEPSSAAVLSLTHPAVLDVVNETLRELSRHDLEAAEQLAHVVSFTPGVADALGEGLLARLQAAGIPIERQWDSRLQFIAPIRKTLQMRSRPAPDSARRLADAFQNDGLPARAACALVGTGQAPQAAASLTRLSFGQLDSEQPTDLLMTLDLLAEQVEEHPRLQLIRAHALGLLARLDEQLDVIERTIALATDVGDGDVLLEAEAERAFLRSLRQSDPVELLAEIDALTGRPSTRGAHVATRLIEARSLALAQSEDPQVLESAIELSRRAVQSWIALGEHGRAATALRLQAMTTLLPRGRYVEADQAVDRALSLSPGTTLDRLRSLVVSCRIAALQGVADHERLSEASALARAHGLPWAEAYVSWASAMLAGVERRTEDVWADFERAWGLLGELRDHPTGATVLAEVAEALCRAGDLERAARLLDRVRLRRAEAEHEVAVAELALAARSGRGDINTLAGVAEHALRARPALRWRVDLYRGVAATRSGSADADTWFDRAASASLESGEGIVDRFERRSPEPAARRVSPIEAATGVPGTPARLADAGDGDDSVRSTAAAEVEIHVLGSFLVTRGGKRVTLPGARSVMLVKTLAMSRGRVAIDVVCDRLWPEVLGHVARRRLKNVLTRTRQALGDVVVRDRDHLRLAPEVGLDVREFSDAAQASTHALATDNPVAVAMALQALAVYRGPLLPDDLYDDNIASVRLVEASRAMALVDAVQACSDDPVIAPVLLGAILRIDPEDYARLQALALWAAERGHAGVAQSSSTLAKAVADGFGFELPGDVAALVTTARSGAPALAAARR